MLKKLFSFNKMEKVISPNQSLFKRNIDEDSITNKKKKKKKIVQVYDGEYYFDFKNALRFVYPYEFVFHTFAKPRWYGLKISDVYFKEFRMQTENTLKVMFDNGKIKINDQKADPNYIIKNGDKLSSFVHRHENAVIAAEINIIYETDDLLVINKPSSIPVHMVGKYRLNTILGILSKEYLYNDLYTVHRLDRLTSGVLILAKNSEKAKEITNLIVSKNISKEYICKVEGEFPDGEIICDQPLEVLDRKLGFRFVYPTGKISLTKFKKIYTDGKTSIVHCKLETGRTHQIRVHLQFLGFPIINDPFYNSYVFGPNKGKNAEYINLKSIEQLVKDIYEEHPVEKFLSESLIVSLNKNELESDLFSKGSLEDLVAEKPLEMQNTIIENKILNKHLEKLEYSTENFEEDIEKLKKNEILKKSDIPYLFNKKEMCFDKKKFTVSASCEVCQLIYKKPTINELSLYLHALKYKMNDQEFFADPPNWANFSDEFDYKNLKY